ncbi:MAG: hypothetical protein ACTSX8_03135 [Alphaproteobacteria bacterium]
MAGADEPTRDQLSGITIDKEMRPFALPAAGDAHSGDPFRRTAPKTRGTTENRVRDFRDGGGPFAALTQSQGEVNPGGIGVSLGNVGGILGRTIVE